MQFQQREVFMAIILNHFLLLGAITLDFVFHSLLFICMQIWETENARICAEDSSFVVYLNLVSSEFIKMFD